MAVQLDGLRTQVDPHWMRGISYLKIGLRWLKSAVNKGRPLLQPIALFTVDPEPCWLSWNEYAEVADTIRYGYGAFTDRAIRFTRY